MPEVYLSLTKEQQKVFRETGVCYMVRTVDKKVFVGMAVNDDEVERLQQKYIQRVGHGQCFLVSILRARR